MITFFDMTERDPREGKGQTAEAAGMTRHPDAGLTENIRQTVTSCGALSF